MDEMPKKTDLVGYARKMNDGNHIKVALLKDVIAESKPIVAFDGVEYVEVFLNVDKLRQILSDDRHMTAAVIGDD